MPCHSDRPRGRWLRWVALAALPVAVVALWLVWQTCHRRERPRPAELPQMTLYCAQMTLYCEGSLLFVVVELQSFIRQHGSPPHSERYPTVADPRSLGLDRQGHHVCPLSVGEGNSWQGGRGGGCGLRMFNWHKERWIVALAQLQEREIEKLPLVWCAKPVHSGKRCVVFARPMSYPQTLGDAFPLTDSEYMTEVAFQRMMQRVRGGGVRSDDGATGSGPSGG